MSSNKSLIRWNVFLSSGVEIRYDLYNPTIVNISCLRLERRLDESIRYLRDAPQEYSEVPFDMVPEIRSPDDPVPVNAIKVCVNYPYGNVLLCANLFIVSLDS